MNIFALIVLIVLNNVTAFPSHEFDENMLDLFSEAVLGDGQNRRQLQTEMSSECLDKLCYMMQSFATCEVFPIQWNKDCAKYFVGYLVDCPAYPSKDQITDAPSICLQDLMSLKSGMPNMSDISGGNRSDDCQLHCYQQYLERSLDLFETCGDELKTSRFQKVSQLGTFTIYRGQVCAMNENSDNCMDLLPAPTDSSQPNPLLDYSCSLPDQAYANLCLKFSAQKCCFSNQQTVLEQTLNQMYAPCVMNRLSKCPVPVNVYTDSFCSKGTLRDLSTISLTVEMHLTKQQGLPDMSNYNSTLRFRAIMTAPLGLSPLEVVVMSYQYFNDTSSVQENAAAATYGKFSIMLTDASSSNSTWQQDLSIVVSPQYIQGIASGYQISPSLIAVTLDGENYYNADPIDTDAASSIVLVGRSTLVMMLVGAALLLL